ncbi:hypothetical protein BGZ94_000102, partial [Podila epigama]
GGRYDPIDNELSEDSNWALHIMVSIYFFFTVIVMLNVLIALINGGFNKGEVNWRLVWLENRLRYVESAENMSYHVPGYRQAHDWFPKEIYYTATKKQVDDYENLVLNKSGDLQEIMRAHQSQLQDMMKERVVELMASITYQVERLERKMLNATGSSDNSNNSNSGSSIASGKSIQETVEAKGKEPDFVRSIRQDINAEKYLNQQTELQQLRQRVDKLVLQQEETLAQNRRLEQMIEMLVAKL